MYCTVYLHDSIIISYPLYGSITIECTRPQDPPENSSTESDTLDTIFSSWTRQLRLVWRLEAAIKHSPAHSITWDVKLTALPKL